MTQTTDDTRVLDTLRRAVDGASAGRVFGEPVTQDGVIVLPVAKVSGGGGGGGGTGPAADGSPEGSGGGFGTSAKGLGVFVLREGKVSWHPAIDVNRVVLGGQIVAVVALLVARSVLRDHGRSARIRFPRLRPTGQRSCRGSQLRARVKALRPGTRA